jgi:hypothetical protein
MSDVPFIKLGGVGDLGNPEDREDGGSDNDADGDADTDDEGPPPLEDAKEA